WDFVQFLTSKTGAQSYIKDAKRPTARRDLIDTQEKDAVLGVFVKQLGYAKSIPIYHDRKFAEFINGAISDVVDDNKNPTQALSDAQKLVNGVLPLEGIYPLK
ncbi:MAG: hypothetical protein AAB592_03700, partial [Patescibacteria group bacterium]